MSDSTAKEKKKWSKKKKIVVIVLSVLLALLMLIIGGGVYALHVYCEPKEFETIEISEQTNVSLIAHRGMSSVAPENTLPAFENAGLNKYWGAECDIYRTLDGVWVISHDSHTYRMMDKSAFVEKRTYDELMEMTVDNGSNISEYPDLKMCTLKEYLEMCRRFHMTAIIELKGTKNTEYYAEVVDLVRLAKVDAQYISFHIKNLEKIRKLTDAPVYFLVQKISQKDIDAARKITNCGISFNGTKDQNFKTDKDGKNMILKCREQGVKVAAWTIDTQEDFDRLVENEVTTITTNSIKYEIIRDLSKK